MNTNTCAEPPALALDPYADLGESPVMKQPFELLSAPSRTTSDPRPPNFTFDNGIRYRVLIADDHPLFREGVRSWIERQPRLVFCGEADSHQSAREAVKNLNPHLAVLGLRLHGEDSIELIKLLGRENPGLRILVVAQSNEMLLAESALRAGARGLIMKDQDANDFLSAITNVLQGEIYLNNRLTSLILKKAYFGDRIDSITKKLSTRELQVFSLLGLGHSTREIAARLNLSRRTVNVHRENIKRKLGIKAAPNLVYAAITWMQHRSSQAADPLPSLSAAAV